MSNTTIIGIVALSMTTALASTCVFNEPVQISGVLSYSEEEGKIYLYTQDDVMKIELNF